MNIVAKTNLLIDPENLHIYQRAVELFNARFHTTNLYNYKKYPKDTNWNKTKCKPDPNITGVGIVTGTTCNINRQPCYIFALDIDIYRKEKMNEVMNKILEYIYKPVYIEETPSGGRRIIFYSTSNRYDKSEQFNFAEKNDAARHKDNVEFFASGKQIVTAPSKARNKAGDIRDYRHISGPDLFESAILSEYDMENLLLALRALSSDYSSQVFRHEFSIPEEKRGAILQRYLDLKSKDYVCGPLYNGERHCSISSWKNGVDDSEFNKPGLTGIVLKLGKQKNNKYLNCFDIDGKQKHAEFAPIYVQQFKGILGDEFYYEESVSEGYHIIFETDRPLDINRKYKLKDGKTLEVLCSDNDTVNIAPGYTYINKYEYSGKPEYNICRQASKITYFTRTGADEIRTFLNTLESARKSTGFNNTRYNSNKAEDKDVNQYMRQYGSISEINRQIKTVFPNVIDLLNFLEIRHSGRMKPLYINFFSLYADDGHNPDAILFYNKNNDQKNHWAGYSVQDFHSGEVLSFAHYLCKYRQDLFDILMDKTGLGKKNITISPASNPVLRTYTCEKYITDQISAQILNDINKAIMQNQSSEKHTRILIVAPTGTGKTEMFYRLAEDKKIRMILALPYTAQVLQGQNIHSVPGVVEGLCGNDREVPETGSIFMTYDKSPVVAKKINPQEYIMVMDEAHNSVNQINFRGDAIRNLEQLASRCKAEIMMTATPEYNNYHNFDLIIRVKFENQLLKQAYVYEYQKQAVKFITNILLTNHVPGHIDAIYTRSKKRLSLMKKILENKNIETYVLNGDIKDNSEIYKNIINNQKLSSDIFFKEGGVLLTTNLIVDGVNILDKNIGNIYLVDIQSCTDLIQFSSRFRNGFENFILVVSGNTPAYIEKMNRDQLVCKYYNMAQAQKQSYDRFNLLMTRTLEYSGIVTDKEISLTDRYSLLDKNGNISMNTLMMKVQEAEARRMNYNINEIKAFLQNYNFNVTDWPQNNVISSNVTDEEIELVKIAIAGETKAILTALFNILINKGNKFSYIFKCIMMDYLKKRKEKEFPELFNRYNIKKHKYTAEYKTLFESSECMKVLKKYCTGLELNAEKPILLIKYSDKDIQSIKRTHHNLMLEKAGKTPLNNDKYLRFIELRRCIRKIRKTGEEVTLSSDQLKAFAKKFNSHYSAVYKNSDQSIQEVVEDLKDIFNIETIVVNKKRVYTVKEEWTLNNIHGLKFI